MGRAMGLKGKWIGALVCLVPLAMLAPVAAAADPTVPEPPVRVVCGPLPFISDGPHCEGGIGGGLARRACADAGLTCQFDQYPWPRALKEIESARADIAIGPFHSPEREVWMVYSADHFYVDQMWLFRAASAATKSGWRPRRIGVPLGWVIGVDLTTWPGVEVEPVRTVDIALAQLAAARLDAVATHARAVARHQQGDPAHRFLPVGAPLAEQKSYMGYSLSFAATDRRARFEAAYAALLSSRFYADLLARNKPMEGMVTEVAARAHQFGPSPP